MKKLFILVAKGSYTIESINPNNQHLLVKSFGADNIALHTDNETYLMVSEMSLGKYGSLVDGYNIKPTVKLQSNIEEFNRHFGTAFTEGNVIFVNNLTEALV